jgi:Tfp pilus assembly protein PilO
MVAAVSLYLGIPPEELPEKSPDNQRVQSLEEKMAEMEKAFAALEEKMNQMQVTPVEELPAEPAKEKKTDGLDFSSFFTQEKVDEHYGNGKGKK